MYMTSAGNTSSIGTAKKVMFDALAGLILALVAWLILYVINPDLVNITFNRGLVTNPSASIGSVGGPSGTNMTLPTSGTKGNCGGIKVVSYAQSQCALVSEALNAMLSCMAKSNLPYGPVTSISASDIGGNLEKAKNCCGGNCKHTDTSCHYGCTVSGQQGYSHAIDYAVPTGAWNKDSLCRVADAAKACGGGRMWGPDTIDCPGGGKIIKYAGHQNHLHIPTAVCNH